MLAIFNFSLFLFLSTYHNCDFFLYIYLHTCILAILFLLSGTMIQYIQLHAQTTSVHAIFGLIIVLISIFIQSTLGSLGKNIKIRTVQLYTLSECSMFLSV